MSHDLPPWLVVYQQAQRWLSVGWFKQLAEDLRAVLRMVADLHLSPSTASCSNRPLSSSPIHNSLSTLAASHGIPKAASALSVMARTVINVEDGAATQKRQPK